MPVESEKSAEERLEALARYVLDSEANICLVARRVMATKLNEKVLGFVPGNEYIIKAADEFKFNMTCSSLKEQEAPLSPRDRAMRRVN